MSRSPQSIAWSRLLPLTLVALLSGMLLGGGSVYLSGISPHAHTEKDEPKSGPRYHCPMHPNYVADGPGKCPICGMDLVPIEDEPEGHAAPLAGLASVSIDPQRQQLIGLQLAQVLEGNISGGFRTSGRVAIDETRVRRVNVKVQGYVEKVYADFIGKSVIRGKPLFLFYSPELVVAQTEYLLARKARALKTPEPLTTEQALAGTGVDLVASSLTHLAHWDIPSEIISQLELTGAPVREIPIVSPISGIVTAKTIVPGATLNAGDTPFEITDLSVVWFLADVYESELSRVQRGTQAEVTFKAFPGRTVKGKVAFLDPIVKATSRTVTVRIELLNPDGELRPEMFGEARLLTDQRKALQIPFDAVVDTGDRKVAFVALGGGKFQPRQIQTGVRNGEHIEVVSGLKAAEEVVSRANFLIDSESRLQSALSSLGGQ